MDIITANKKKEKDGFAVTKSTTLMNQTGPSYQGPSYQIGPVQN